MKRGVTNFGASVRARLLAVAQKENVQFEYILLRYALERFLYRLGLSEYADRFILKGATAFAVWLGPFCRVTRDVDVEAFGNISTEELISFFKTVCLIPYEEDAVEFDVAVGDSVYPIAEEIEYPTLLDHESPKLKIYSRYTVVAEKFSTMIH